MVHRVSLSSALLLVLLVSLPAGAQSGTATACNEQNAACRDDCTMDFGTSRRTQSQLYRCIEACQTTHQRCTERWNELREANIEPDFVPERPRPINDDIFISEEQPAPGHVPVEPVPVPEEIPTPRTDDSGRTRFASPEEPARAREPSMRVQQEDYNEGISLPDDEQLAPPGEDPPGEPEERSERTERSDRAERTERKPEPKKSSAKKKSHPDLPPEPEYDISDWDPDGR